jgi:hypothetical protein
MDPQTATPPRDDRAATKPPLVDADVEYLHYPVNKTVAALQEAQTALAAQPPDIQDSRAALDLAQQAVAEVTGYYLPLTEARDHLILAYWKHMTGQNERRDGDLAAASNQLTRLLEKAPAPAQSDAEELLTILNSLELHKQTDSTFIRDLSNLCEKIKTHLRYAPLKLGMLEDSPAADGKRQDDVSNRP